MWAHRPTHVWRGAGFDPKQTPTSDARKRTGRHELGLSLGKVLAEDDLVLSAQNGIRPWQRDRSTFVDCGNWGLSSSFASMRRYLGT
jgi:hypothetical protein